MFAANDQHMPWNKRANRWKNDETISSKENCILQLLALTDGVLLTKNLTEGTAVHAAIVIPLVLQESRTRKAVLRLRTYLFCA